MKTFLYKQMQDPQNIKLLTSPDMHIKSDNLWDMIKAPKRGFFGEK